MSVLSTIMPPNSMNSGIGGRTRANAAPSLRPSNTAGASARPETAAPSMSR